jgi:tRNA (guanine26-N2/guanine27-N2)-dimethyltransferase
MNRDISILLAKIFNPTDCLLPLASSGIRGVRLKKEANIPNLYLNDINPDAISIMHQNLRQNNVTAAISQKEANRKMLEGRWDYIDIDPFGSPNPFIQSALFSIRHKGIIALTATDTAPLSGTYTTTCRRKYWARPLKNHLMHETGLRILIRKAQLIGMQFEMALLPIVSYWEKHYFRVFFQVIKSKAQATRLLSDHKYLLYEPTTTAYTLETMVTKDQLNHYAGPLWSGQLCDPDLLDHILAQTDERINQKTITFLNILKAGTQTKTQFFYDLHRLAKVLKLRSIPKQDQVITSLHKDGYFAARTHFSPSGIKTNAPLERVKQRILQNE